MNNKGYIYLMINPAIPNMVKIGKNKGARAKS